MELEVAAMEQMKITELRIAKLYSDKARVVSETDSSSSPISTKPQGILVIYQILFLSQFPILSMVSIIKYVSVRIQACTFMAIFVISVTFSTFPL